MKLKFAIFALLLSALAAQSSTPASAPRAALPGKPVARVNGAILTDRDLLQEMYAIFPYAAQHGGFPRNMEADIRKGALKMIVFEELVYQEALRRKLQVAPAALERAVAEYRNKFPSPEEYQQYFKTELNGSQELLRAKVRRKLLIEQMLKLEVTSKATPSDSDLKTYYTHNPERFRVPESFGLQTITILPPPNATPAQLADVQKRAEAAFQQARNAKTYDQFGLLAEKISEDDYRVMMGDHKAVDRAKLPAQILSAIASMKPGEVSGLLQVDRVYTIVRLTGHFPPHVQKFEEIKAPLRQQLEKTRAEQFRVALDKKLRSRAKVEEL